MRTRFIKILCLFSVLTLLFSYSLVPAAQGYNDKKFDRYVNMGENAVKNNYTIPHMFRQDAPYAYLTKFPLVVTGGVEYVPLSMFILYSYIEVIYNGYDENFYLINNKNGNFISFNVEQNVAENHDGELMKMVTKLFYQTRYVPARKVAEALDMKCETYDDPRNGIYAFRISNGRSDKTLNDLIAPYLPETENNPEEDVTVKPEIKDDTPKPPEVKPPKEEDKNPSVPEVTPDGGKENSPQNENVTQEPQDPIEKLNYRRLSLCFTGMNYKDAERIADTLRWQSIKAAFSFTKSEILNNPALVRRLYVDGNSIFVTAQPNFDAVAQNNPDVTGESLELLYANAFVSELESANEALKLVLKAKTRMCTLPYNIPPELKESTVFEGAIKRAGYIVYTANVDSSDTPDYKGSAYNIFAKIKNKVTGSHYNDAFDVYALLYCSDKSVHYINDIAGLIHKYEKLSFFTPDEYDCLIAKEN